MLYFEFNYNQEIFIQKLEIVIDISYFCNQVEVTLSKYTGYTYPLIWNVGNF